MGDYRLKQVAKRCEVSERTARRWRDGNDWRWIRACEEFEQRDQVAREQREKDELRERARQAIENDPLQYLAEDDFWQNPDDILPMKRLNLGLLAEDLSQVMNRLGFLITLESKIHEKANTLEELEKLPDSPDKQNWTDCIKIRDTLRALADRILPPDEVSPGVLKWFREGCPSKDLQK